MRRSFLAAFAALSIACAAPALALAQPADPAALIAAQKAALAPLAIMDGVWRGPAWTMDRTGRKHEVTQTERIGPFLGGAVKVIEGRGYDASGAVTFNAFGVMSYDPVGKTFSFKSWALGRQGDFPLTVTADGYIWSTPAGPNASIRYTAVIKGDAWREIGEYIAEGQPPRQIFEMNLKRIGDTDWPGGGAVPKD
ncbi:MAG: DUF1579 domain-containing protein [Caulobacterales bacterium]|nr:DUF1579 domain-containing protein [Caulobacterales bacterium]